MTTTVTMSVEEYERMQEQVAMALTLRDNATGVIVLHEELLYTDGMGHRHIKNVLLNGSDEVRQTLYNKDLECTSKIFAFQDKINKMEKKIRELEDELKDTFNIKLPFFGKGRRVHEIR